SLNREQNQRFSWNFDDIDEGDTQSAFELRYRLASDDWWMTIGPTDSTVTHYDMPAGTLNFDDYEWQVRTADAQGLWGPWSSSAFFSSVNPPDGPSITDPTNGSTISTESYTVKWSSSVQESYQIRTVADNG